MHRFLLRGMAGFAMGVAASFGAPKADAASLTYAFSYTQASTTYEFGTVTVSTSNSLPSILTVRVTAPASAPAAIAGVQITGVVYAFTPNVTSAAVINPGNNAYQDDLNSLNWAFLTNMNAIPNPANSSAVRKGDFEFGASTGNGNNFNPPGVALGQSDVFMVSIGGLPSSYTASGAWANLDIASFIDHIGIRIQSIDNSVNGGSLLLVGAVEAPPPPPPPPPGPSIPEPATLALFGAAMLGLGAVGRRRRRG